MKNNKNAQKKSMNNTKEQLPPINLDTVISNEASGGKTIHLRCSELMLSNIRSWQSELSRITETNIAEVDVLRFAVVFMNLHRDEALEYKKSTLGAEISALKQGCSAALKQSK